MTPGELRFVYAVMAMGWRFVLVFLGWSIVVDFSCVILLSTMYNIFCLFS